MYTIYIQGVKVMMESRSGDKFGQAHGQRRRDILLLMVALPIIATLALVAVGVLRGRPVDFAQLLSNGHTPWRVHADSGAVGVDWGERTETTRPRRMTPGFGEDHEHWSAEDQECAMQASPATPSAAICDSESSGIHGPHTLGSLLPVVAWNGTAFVLGRADNPVNNISGHKRHDVAFLPAPGLGQELTKDTTLSAGAGEFRMNKAKAVAPVNDPLHWDLDDGLGWVESRAIQLNCLTLPLPLQALETGILPSQDNEGGGVSAAPPDGTRGNFEAPVAAEATCPSAFLWR